MDRCPTLGTCSLRRLYRRQVHNDDDRGSFLWVLWFPRPPAVYTAGFLLCGASAQKFSRAVTPEQQPSPINVDDWSPTATQNLPFFLRPKRLAQNRTLSRLLVKTSRWRHPEDDDDNVHRLYMYNSRWRIPIPCLSTVFENKYLRLVFIFKKTWRFLNWCIKKS